MEMRQAPTTLLRHLKLVFIAERGRPTEPDPTPTVPDVMADIADLAEVHSG